MFDKAAREQAVAEMNERLDRVERLIQDIHVSLIVRDIPTQRAMDAYDGLRKQVALAARARREHQAQLVQLKEALQAGSSADDIARLSNEWCLQAGVREVWEFGDGSLFSIEGDRTWRAVQVHRPAWIDDDSGAMIRQGIAVMVNASSHPTGTDEGEATVTRPEDSPVDQAEPDLTLDESPAEQNAGTHFEEDASDVSSEGTANGADHPSQETNEEEKK
jgi:hypothetical protein